MDDDDDKTVRREFSWWRRDPNLTNQQLAQQRLPGWISGFVRIIILLLVALVFVAALLPLAVRQSASDGHPWWLLLWLLGFVGVFVVWLRGWMRGRDRQRSRPVGWIVVSAALLGAVMIALVWSVWRRDGFGGLIDNADALVAGLGILGMMLTAIAMLRPQRR